MVTRRPLPDSYGRGPFARASPGGVRTEVLLFGAGEARIRRGGITRVGIQPKVFALLARLALERRSGFVRRDALLALLWPELGSSPGRNALSQTLHRLRAELGEDVVWTRGREEVGLSDAIWCDVRAFRRAMDLGRLPEALRLYRGPLLDSFHLSKASTFDQWLDVERHEVRQAALRAAVALADREEEAGRALDAIGWLKRAVDVSPAESEPLRRLLRAQERTGDRAGAIRTYESAAAKLWVELELEPDAETRAIVDALRETTQPVDPEARGAFLRGRHMSGILGQGQAALASFRRAISLDPQYAAAHAGLAECLATLALQGRLSRAQAALPLEAAARRAIELGPGLGDPHAALGVERLVFSRDWAGADAAFRRAIELDPLSARAHALLAFYLSNMGWMEEGVAEAATAARLDPIDPTVNFLHGFALYRARRYDASLDQLRSLVELHPRHALAHMFIAEGELGLGRTEVAVRSARLATAILPDDPLLLGIGSCVMGFAGEEREAHGLRERLHDCEAQQYVNPHFLAAAHAGVGDLEEAFVCWRRMVDDDEPGAFMLRTDPLFDPLRSDARFQELIARLGFPEVDAPDLGRADRSPRA